MLHTKVIAAITLTTMDKSLEPIKPKFLKTTMPNNLLVSLPH